MNPLADLTVRVTGQLDALRASETASAKARTSCARLAEQLNAPARIGILGLPGSGKRRLLNALSGIDIVASDVDFPTLEMSYGVAEKTEAMLADGTLVHTDGLPSAGILRQMPVFLKVQVPAPPLFGRSLLMIVSEANSQDATAALTWAAEKVDICLWCTHSFSAVDRGLWRTAPDRLLNHAILIRTGSDNPPNFRPQDEGFETGFVIRADHAEAKDPFARLESYLSAVVDEAKTQEIHAAQMVLQRYGGDLLNLPQDDSAEAFTESAAGPELPEIPAYRTSPKGRSELSRMFQHLRSSADSLRRTIGPGEITEGDIETVFSTAEDTFETLSERAADLDGLEDGCAVLSNLFLEAHDLALLLRMEGGLDRAVDAAQLMLQVRNDMEVMLAA